MNKNYKGPAESKEQEKKYLLNDMPVDKVAGAGKGKKHYKKGGAQYKEEGAGDYDVKKGSHDHPHGGPGRMGFTQNFGPARQNSYAKGAAKVAKIMGYPGAGDHIEGHLKEVSVSAPDNSSPEKRSDVVAEGLSIKEQRLANQTRGIMNLRNMKTRDSSLVDMDNPSKAKQMFNFNLYPDDSKVNSGGRIEYVGAKSQGGNYEHATENTDDDNIMRNFPESNFSGEHYNKEQADQIIKYKNLLKDNANKVK